MYTARTRCRSCVCGGNEKQAGPRGGPGKERRMKKKFKLEDLDCANCAAKMEEAIKKLPGVHDASVSFMHQKMTVDADDDRFDDIMKEVVAVCAKVEPDCKILL